MEVRIIITNKVKLLPNVLWFSTADEFCWTIENSIVGKAWEAVDVMVIVGQRIKIDSPFEMRFVQ